MKSIEKPLTIVLLIAFTLLVYFFECRPSQEEKLIEESNHTKEIIEEETITIRNNGLTITYNNYDFIRIDTVVDWNLDTGEELELINIDIFTEVNKDTLSIK